MGCDGQFLLLVLVPVLYAERRLRSTAAGWSSLTSVDCGVEIGVVIHLELAVKFETASAFEEAFEEVVEAAGEVGPLLFEQSEAGQIAVAVGLGGTGAVGLFAGVEDAKREDGQAIDDQARSFGVERGCGVLWGLVCEEPEVDLFHKVVAALVVAVDGVLYAGDLGVGGLGVAGLVFFVPEVEVFAMLGGDEGEEFVGRCGLRDRGVVPGNGEVVVESDDG